MLAAVKLSPNCWCSCFSLSTLLWFLSLSGFFFKLDNFLCYCSPSLKNHSYIFCELEMILDWVLIELWNMARQSMMEGEMNSGERLKKRGAGGLTRNGLALIFTSFFGDNLCVQQHSGALKLVVQSSKKIQGPWFKAHKGYKKLLQNGEGENGDAKLCHSILPD